MIISFSDICVSRFEVGSGFAGTEQRGSQHNDPFVKLENGKIGTLTNNSGGIQGYVKNPL